MPRIVVGVDDSPGAVAALRWALGAARTREATLEVVHAYDTHLPDVLHGGLGVEVLATELTEHVRDDAETLVEAALAKVDAGDSGVIVTRQVVAGRPAEALVRRSRDADLLIVGSRGRGGFSGLLLGSVSQQCLHHAVCPVVIVPHSRAASRPHPR